MTTATITKTLNKLNLQNKNYSLGFNRFSVLPTRVRKAINLAHLLNTGNTNTHNTVVSFFNSLTELEYVNYLKIS